jgi:hypothetical protein
MSDDFGPDHRGFKKGLRVECHIRHPGYGLDDAPFSRRGTVTKRRATGLIYVVALDVPVRGRRAWDLSHSDVRPLGLLDLIAEAAQ